jgi:hypothetical protein
MRTTLALAAVAAAATIAALPAAATQNRVARCTVRSGGEHYDGLCRFLPEDGGGSFSAAPASGEPFFGNVEEVSLIVVRRGLAAVRGLTAQGLRSRWCIARRSGRDLACWEGTDFSVCAY